MHSSFHKPFKTIFNSDDRQPMVVDAGLADTADHRIEPGAIAASGENSNSFHFLFSHV